MAQYIPPSIMSQSWAGQERQCPACSTAFKSVTDRGQCVNCRFYFRASEHFGLNPNTTLERELEIPQSKSDEITKLPLKQISEIPKSVYEWKRLPDEQEEFNFFLGRFVDAINEGAEMFEYVVNQPRYRHGIIYAIKDNRVVASLVTELLLAD